MRIVEWGASAVSSLIGLGEILALLTREALLNFLHIESQRSSKRTDISSPIHASHLDACGSMSIRKHLLE